MLPAGLGRVYDAPGAEGVHRCLFQHSQHGGKAKTLDDVQEMGLGGAVALVKEFAGSDEKTRRILTEVFKRLAVDIGEEMASSAQDGLKQARDF